MAIQSNVVNPIFYLNTITARISNNVFKLSKIFQSYTSVNLELLDTKQIADEMALVQRQLTQNSHKFIELFNEFNSEIQQHMQQLVCPNPGSKDITSKKFIHEEWQTNLALNFIKNCYLSYCSYVKNNLAKLDLDRKLLEKFELYAKNHLESISPNNNLFINPELIKTTIETQGFNLLLGLANMLDDLVANNGHFAISMTDKTAFKVGENIAVTPGKVIFRNDIMELIYYTPVAEQVYSTPIIVVPPFINKYYILDLNPDKSYVKWLTEQGFAVFIISWVNPTASHADKSFSDYVIDGPVAAINQISEILQCEKVHVVSYCVGGTTSACAVAYLNKIADERVASITYLATMLNFDDIGEMKVFVDEGQINKLSKMMEKIGYLDGRLLSNAFILLRPDDLIWPFFINNYLLGKKPKPFDLLFWNSDPTNLPAKMYSYYLKEFCLNNKLAIPGEVEIHDIPISIQDITQPACFVSTESDHISPWKTTYLGLHLHGGDTKFILSGSGHIAGIVNPPHKNKYHYWTNNKIAKKPETWLKNATKHQGSWWNNWCDWLVSLDNAKVSAIKDIPEEKVITDAPGNYVVTAI